MLNGGGFAMLNDGGSVMLNGGGLNANTHIDVIAGLERPTAQEEMTDNDLINWPDSSY